MTLRRSAGKQFVIDAARELVGVGPQVVRIDRDRRRESTRVIDRRAGLLAGLEVAIAVDVVPGVLLLVVGVRVDAVEDAAARRR